VIAGSIGLCTGLLALLMRQPKLPKQTPTEETLTVATQVEAKTLVAD
jgi:hypothetical protein